MPDPNESAFRGAPTAGSRESAPKDLSSFQVIMRYIAAIRDIGNGVDTVPHTFFGAVLERDGDKGNAQDIEPSGLSAKTIERELGYAAAFDRTRAKNVAKSLTKLLAGPIIAVEGNGFSLDKIVTPELIYPTDVVGMRMGVENGINWGIFALRACCLKSVDVSMRILLPGSHRTDARSRLFFGFLLRQTAHLQLMSSGHRSMCRNQEW